MRFSRYTFYALMIAAAGLMLYAFTIATWPGKTASIRVIDSGSIGPYKIGETKSEILSNGANQRLSPYPKPEECPGNWIKVSEMDNTQRACLFKTNQWEASFNMKLCTEHEDSHVTLYFKEQVLYSISARCSFGI
jgi:hypothetical protein